MAAWEWSPNAEAAHVRLPCSTAGDMVKALAVDDDGRVFVGLDSGALRAYRPFSGELERELLPASADSAILCLLVHERLLWSGGRDRLIRCFALERGRECTQTRTLRGHFAAVKGLYAGAANRVWSLSEDRTLRCWRVANGTPVLLIRSTEFLMLCAAVSAQQPCAVTAESASVAVYRTGDGVRTALLEGHIGVVWALLTHGDAVFSGGEDATVRIWSLSRSERVHILRGHRRRVTALALSPDARTLFSAGDGSVRAWRTDTGECTLIMLSGGGAVRSLAVSQDGTLLFAGGADAVVRQYSTCDGALICEHVGHSDNVHLMAVSPSGQLWSGSYDGDTRGWLVQLPWRWTRDNHALWPKPFRAATRAFLCCVARSDCAVHVLAVGGADTRDALLDAVLSSLAASIKGGTQPS